METKNAFEQAIDFIKIIANVEILHNSQSGHENRNKSRNREIISLTQMILIFTGRDVTFEYSNLEMTEYALYENRFEKNESLIYKSENQ